MAIFKGWEAAVLKAIKAPVTAANVHWLDAWQVTEGGTAKNNPLNTTEPSPGATVYNSIGVKNYTTPAAGAAATAATLLNGYYPAIVAALRSGDPAVYANSNAVIGPKGESPSTIVAELKKWGSKRFAAAVGSNQYPQQPGGQQVTGQGSNPYGNSPTSTAAAAAGAGGDLFSGFFGGLEKWITKEAGYALLYLGLVAFAIVLALIGVLRMLGVKPGSLVRSAPAAVAA